MGAAKKVAKGRGNAVGGGIGWHSESAGIDFVCQDFSALVEVTTYSGTVTTVEYSGTAVVCGR